MPDHQQIVELLESWRRAEPHRATGGLYALSGFDYQIRCVLADLALGLVKGGEDLHRSGEVFLEALSDALRSVDSGLVCVQVKRTITAGSLAKTANEIEAIHAFLTTQHPDVAAHVRIEVVGARSDGATWDTVVEGRDTGSPLRALWAEGRLLPPRIDPDPWWRLVSTVYRELDDPYAFARFALDRALRRGLDAAGAVNLRDDIAEHFACLRARPKRLGRVLTSAELEPAVRGGVELLIGQMVTPERLRDGHYMQRHQRITGLLQHVELHRDIAVRGDTGRVGVVWLCGRSGVGKSVLLVQLLEALVRAGRPVVWLGNDVDQLEPLLRALALDQDEQGPEFILVDDLYDREARDVINLAALGRFLEINAGRRWPVIVTCGPPEFEAAFQDDAKYRGFDVHRVEIQPVGEHEADGLADWYRQRTGRPAQRGPAFDQAKRGVGLFLSMAVELGHGDLHQFAARFADRIELNNLSDALRLPLALNRLYVSTPESWFDRASREAIEHLNQSGDFSLAGSTTGNRYVRLTHPHLADAIYSALRKGATPLARANDLIAAFERSLALGDQQHVRRLLRAYSHAAHDDLIADRLADVDADTLIQGCALAWKRAGAEGARPTWATQDEQADVAVSWACLTARYAALGKVLGIDSPLADALAVLERADVSWPTLWQRLRAAYPRSADVLSWGQEAVTRPQLRAHPQWSFVWEKCEPASGAKELWIAAAQSWLRDSDKVPDWHFVWRRLLVCPASDDWARDSGRNRLSYALDRPEWAFVAQDLIGDAASHGDSSTVADVLRGCAGWLIGREDRPEWSYVWRLLVERHTAIPSALDVTESSLLDHGWQWLIGREDRPEWSHVWRLLVERHTSIPSALGVTESSLLDLGWQWLRGREDRPEWSHVWRMLVERHTAIPFALAVTKTSLLGHGWQWLREREDRPEWTFVWQQLVEHQTALPPDLGVTEGTLLRLGFQWLSRHEDRPEWSHVWERLVERQTALPPDLGVTEGTLLRLGWQWLREREDRPEWTFVWRMLVECCTDLPPDLGVTESSLLGLGWQWLMGRADRPEWTFVWRMLVECYTDLPPDLGVTESSLLGLGWQWLSGHEDRPEWSHVWERLVERQTALPPDLGVTEGTLLRLGFQWLSGHEDRPEWSHVWERLVERQTTLLPDLGVTEGTLLRLGFQWLRGHEDRPEWSHVWERLVERQTALPPDLGVTEGTLLLLGFQWLSGHEDRPDWTFVWERLVERQTALPPDLGVTEGTLLRLGFQWLSGHEDRPDWTFVWQRLVERQTALPPDLGVTEGTLLRLGFQWLSGHEDRPEWSHVWGRVLDGATRQIEPVCPEDVIERGRLWLVQHEGAIAAPVVWSRMARHLTLLSAAGKHFFAEFGLRWITSPAHRESKSFGWVAGGLFDAGLVNEPALEVIDQWLMVTRHPSRPYVAAKRLAVAPADSGATRLAQRLNSWLNRGGFGQSQDFRRALEPLLDRPLQDEVARLMQRVFPLSLVQCASGAEVAPPGAAPRVGDVVLATVTGHQPYGVFVLVADCSGLLHVSVLPQCERLDAQYPLGSTLSVRVLERTAKGLVLALA